MQPRRPAFVCVVLATLVLIGLLLHDLPVKGTTGTGPVAGISPMGSSNTMHASVLEAAVAPAAIVTLLGRSPRPTSTSSSHRPIELGMRFTVSGAGVVTALRVWRSTNGGSIRNVSLWSSAGLRLAVVPMAGTGHGGWQRAALSRPVPLQRGRTYVVSYYAPLGGYVSTSGYFRVTRTVGPLSALRVDNGVFRAGGSGYPRTGTTGTNFYADVEFRPTTSQSPQTGCLSRPSRCGFPDATNTGVPRGVTLTVVRGDVHTTHDGQVINGLDIRGTLWIDNSNVTVENTRVIGPGDPSWAIQVGDVRPVSGVVIVHCTVDANGSDQGGVVSASSSGSWAMYWSDVSDGENLLRPGGHALIQNNYLHDLRSTGPAPHFDVVEVYEGSRTSLIHNTMVMTQDQTSVVNIQGTFTPVSATLIERNLINGGGYELNVRNTQLPVRGTEVIGNRFGDQNVWGYSVIEDVTTSVVSGNVRDATGRNIDTALR